MKLQTKVVLAQPIHPKGLELLKENVETVVVAPSDDPAVLVSLMDDKVEGVIVRYNVFNREMIEHAPNLKVIARHGIGVELIDQVAATEHGVMVTNTPTAATTSVAEHVILMILMLAKNIQVGMEEFRNGNYAIKNNYGPDDVEFKTVGFLGLGRIGREAARRCQGLDMKVIGYDPYLKKEDAAKLNIELKDTMEEVLRESDYVSLHTPLTPETKHMISTEQLAMMKPTAFLINCSRGAVVDEPALIEALQKKVIAGAGLDVFEAEPPEKDNPLLFMKNVVVTPHSSSLTTNGKIKMSVGAVEQLLKVLRGEKPDYLVNKDVLNK